MKNQKRIDLTDLLALMGAAMVTGSLYGLIGIDGLYYSGLLFGVLLIIGAIRAG